MKTRFYLIILLFLASFSFLACEDILDPIVCTEEFRFVSLEVSGGELDGFFTIRKDTGDTIRFDQQALFDNNYPVLDDTFQETLEGNTEDFEFVGFQQDNEVVREIFEIKADKCHIEKVSGAVSVTI